MPASKKAASESTSVSAAKPTAKLTRPKLKPKSRVTSASEVPAAAAAASGQPVTRAQNAEAHPGLDPTKRKRRTPAEKAADDQVKKDEALAKEAERQEAYQYIADLESELLQEDIDNELTPRHKPSHTTRPLVRTETYLDLADSDGEDEDVAMEDGASAPTSEFRLDDGDGDGDTDIEEAAPPKKKAKGVKASQMSTIPAAEKEHAAVDTVAKKKGKSSVHSAIADCKKDNDHKGDGDDQSVKGASKQVSKLVNHFLTTCSLLTKQHFFTLPSGILLRNLMHSSTTG